MIAAFKATQNGRCREYDRRYAHAIESPYLCGCLSDAGDFVGQYCGTVLSQLICPAQK